MKYYTQCLNGILIEGLKAWANVERGLFPALKSALFIGITKRRAALPTEEIIHPYLFGVWAPKVAPATASELSTHPPNVEVRTIYPHYPPPVSKIIGRSGRHLIGILDEPTVLKYPYIPGDRVGIEVEAELLEILGSHPRIIVSKGLNEHGLVLQYAKNGSVYDHFTSGLNFPLDQKLRWCRQAVEAVNYIHQKGVIHCDINARSSLLDENINILLADFQGVLKSGDGEILLDGESQENSKSFMPRGHGGLANVKTDMFALGSLFYYIMMGHEPFPELNDWEHDEEIEKRYQNGQFPTDSHACSHITDKCWRQLYESVDEIIFDISQIQVSKTPGTEDQE